jgi:hypothetical protein
MRNVYKILVGKPKGKRPLGRPRSRRKGNTRMYLREMGWKFVYWTHPAQDKDKGQIHIGIYKRRLY